MTLFLSTFTSAIAKTPKSGASCTKLGITKDYKAKKYTCIKSGKKLVWNKGVAIKTAAPAVAPTPTLSPTPTPTPIISPTPTPKYPDAPTSFNDLIENYSGISYAAWSKANSAISAHLKR